MSAQRPASLDPCGFSTYANACPRIEKFRTIIGTPAGFNDLLTAYKVGNRAAARR